jgi:hypothetical protein
MPSIADIITSRRPIGSPGGPSMPGQTPSQGRGTRNLYDAKRGPDGQGPSAPGGDWWDGTGRMPIGTKAPPDDPRVTHPNVPPGDSGSGATPPGAGGGPAPTDPGVKPGPTPGAPGENEFPFDFGKGYEVSEANPNGNQYAPGYEAIPTFADGSAKLGPDQGQNTIDWMSALGLLPEGMTLSGDGYPMLGGGSSGPWGQAGVNAVGAGGKPRYAVVGGQGGYGLGQVGTRYTGPLWNTPPGQTPATTNTNPTVAKPLSALGLPEWLLDPNLFGGAGGSGGSGGGGKPAPGGTGGGTPTIPPPLPQAPNAAPGAPAGIWGKLPPIAPRTAPPAGFTEASGEQLQALEPEMKTRAIELFGPNWGKQANYLYAARQVLDSKQMFAKRIDDDIAFKLGKNSFRLYQPGAEWGTDGYSAGDLSNVMGLNGAQKAALGQWASSNGFGGRLGGLDPYLASQRNPGFDGRVDAGAPPPPPPGNAKPGPNGNGKPGPN